MKSALLAPEAPSIAALSGMRPTVRGCMSKTARWRRIVNAKGERASRHPKDAGGDARCLEVSGGLGIWGSARALAEAAARLQQIHREQQEALPSEWLDHESAAHYIGVSPDSLYRLASEDIIPRHRLKGNRYVYHRREVDQALLRR